MMSDNRPIQEINLKPYVQLLWKRAVWIVALQPSWRLPLILSMLRTA